MPLPSISEACPALSKSHAEAHAASGLDASPPQGHAVCVEEGLFLPTGSLELTLTPPDTEEAASSSHCCLVSPPLPS